MTNRRKELKERLVHLGCEGQEFKRHICYGGLEMNEVIFTRDQFKTKKPKEKEYFWHRINVSMNCRRFHFVYGHTRAFKDFHKEKMMELYDVQKYIDEAPLKIKHA